MKQIKLKTNKIKKSTNGFTLVEMLIYMALLSVFIIVLSSMFLSLFDAKFESNTTTYIEQDNKYIFARMSYDIRRADIINSPQATVSASSKIQKLSLTSGSETIEYSLNNGNLILSVNGVADILNNSQIEVNDLNFKRYSGSDNDLIEVIIKLNSKSAAVKDEEAKVYKMLIGTR